MKSKTTKLIDSAKKALSAYPSVTPENQEEIFHAIILSHRAITEHRDKLFLLRNYHTIDIIDDFISAEISEVIWDIRRIYDIIRSLKSPFDRAKTPYWEYALKTLRGMKNKQIDVNPYASIIPYLSNLICEVAKRIN